MAYKPITQARLIEAVEASKKSLGQPSFFYVIGYLGLSGTKAAKALEEAFDGDAKDRLL